MSYIYRLLKESHREQLSQLTDSLNLARQEIETLCRQEQDAALASAETKQKVHEELLKQEEEMIKLRAEREKLLKEGNAFISNSCYFMNYLTSFICIYFCKYCLF